MNFDIENRDNHVFIKCNLEIMGSDDMHALVNLIEDYPRENIILHLLSVRSMRQHSLLLKSHDQRKKLGMSFIVILNNSLMDEFELTSAFTEMEAYDILEMEEIER